MMLVSMISYIDRNTLAILSPTILKQTGLSTEQYGYIVFVFSLSIRRPIIIFPKWKT